MATGQSVSSDAFELRIRVGSRPETLGTDGHENGKGSGEHHWQQAVKSGRSSASVGASGGLPPSQRIRPSRHFSRRSSGTSSARIAEWQHLRLGEGGIERTLKQTG